MFYYLVDKTVRTERRKPIICPDLPPMTLFSGIPSNYTDFYLIATNTELTDCEQKFLPMQQEDIAEITDWLKYSDILQWFVGDS